MGLSVVSYMEIHKPTLSLMELESVVTRELEALGDELEAIEVAAVAEKKFGNFVRVKAVPNGATNPVSMENCIRELLGAYSFRTELTVESASMPGGNNT